MDGEYVLQTREPPLSVDQCVVHDATPLQKPYGASGVHFTASWCDPEEEERKHVHVLCCAVTYGKSARAYYRELEGALAEVQDVSTVLHAEGNDMHLQVIRVAYGHRGGAVMTSRDTRISRIRICRLPEKIWQNL
eukprot:TRINITY_DN898_c0_g3_i4.p1 TRINITY_DN898_c0_g3~~TRINITY_DN898_c0_g3_i4.p1  ORF type:complete len:135 (-),score=7.23 TRINITY_DN898_c0_g3_i4:325-729(-)